jgi:ATP-dependent helicase HrpA
VPHIESKLKELSRTAKQSLLADRMWANKEITRIRQGLRKGNAPQKMEQRLERLARRLKKSSLVLQARRQARLHLAVDPQLPIADKQDELVSAINEHQVLIVAGETGSGKTTQIPKFCLMAGRGTTGCVGVTQPRRIAAISVSRRIAQELNEPLGNTVGYKIRFKDTSRSLPRIKIMTDGILLSEAHRDPFLNFYDTLIVDEAHERSLNIDFILGILRKLVDRRPDLKLIITSATIDTDKFSAAFGNAPVIEVSGRLYPVEVRYPPSSAVNGEEASSIEKAAEAVDLLEQERRRGDVLIFMPTERDIRDTCEILEGRRLPHTRIIPLFARLSADEQQQVFRSHPGRKIVVATNVAETSITIPGIRYVIDSGLARIAQYTPRSRTTTLPVVPISRSSADQRMGRCGRVANGICIRLFSEDDYNRRPRFTPPEILRSSLADVILRMTALKLGAVDDFPFIDPPAPKSIRDGYNLLMELGALRKTTRRPAASGPYQLTGKGRMMARLPLDPRLSCMLLEAHGQNCLNDLIIIAAALSIQDPRERPLDKQQAADSAHAQFADPTSDFITLLRIWRAYDHSVRKRKSWKQVKQFCRTRFLSFPRMREWRDIHQQLKQVLSEHNVRSDLPPQDPTNIGDIKHSWYANVHRSILAGFLSNIAVKKEKQTFSAAHQRQVMIFPGSGLFKNPGNWIVAAEMVETSRPFARCVAVIDPKWIEPLATAQCAYAHLDPHWSKKRGAVMVTEQVSLYGLVIDRRSKPYGPINPEEATEIFIHNALIEGDVRQPPTFIRNNRRCIAGIEEMEHRIRRKDLLVEEHALYAFYQERLGTVFDMRTLKKRIRDAGGDHFLRMQREDLLNYTPLVDELNRYPKELDISGQRLTCHYHYEPGQESDGITVLVPSRSIGTVTAEAFQWLVPGLLEEKIASLIKALPKQWRKKLVPVSETARRITTEMPVQRNTHLTMALSRFIRDRYGISIPASAWDESLLPEHLRMRIAITDDTGHTVQVSRNTAILKQAAHRSLPDDFQASLQAYERFPIEQWDFGDLAESIQISDSNGSMWTAYPALESRTDGVALCAMTDRTKARKTHLRGVQALLERNFSKDVKYLRKNLKLPPQSEVAGRYFGGPKALEEKLHQRVLRDLMAVDIRTAVDFAAKMEVLQQDGIAGKGQDARQALVEFLEIYHHTRATLHELEKTHAGKGVIVAFITDLRRQLEKLVPDSFLELYDHTQLGNVGRYVKALAIRAQRGVIDPDKDRRKAESIAPYEHRLAELVSSLDAQVSSDKHRAVETLFWMIEEFKISTFAQEVKTAGPISAKRLDKHLKSIEELV